MILYGKNGNRLKESKPQKKISPAALSKDTDAFLRGFRGGTALGGLRPPRAAKKLFYCRVWSAVSSGGTPFGER